MEIAECKWQVLADESEYHSSCDNTFWLQDGSTLEEIVFKFCPFCGKSIKLVMLTDGDLEKHEY
jgi:hypothetical protein